MGLLTFALNLTLDGCQDHRAPTPDDEMMDWFTALIGSAGAMLYGRTTYEMMEEAWPQVARDAAAPRAMRDWAVKLEAIPKYVVSTTRKNYTWANTHHVVEGDLVAATKRLKANTPNGVLVGGPKLTSSLIDEVDEFKLVIHPVIAGKGPTLFHELVSRIQLKLVSSHAFGSGALAVHYRRP